jgi:hypothetical protein
MTNVEKLEAKIARHEAKIAKLTTKIGAYIDGEKFLRTAKAMRQACRRGRVNGCDVLKSMNLLNAGEYYWECCDICYSLEDLEEALRELPEAAAKDSRKAALEAKKIAKASKLEAINCKAIDEFLEKWRVGFIAWAKEDKKFKYMSDERIEEIAAQEVDNKKLDLVARIEEAAGKIVDAKYLEIGKNGSLNGRVIGEKKSVYVDTILAGGPIQRLHYRVLVK